MLPMYLAEIHMQEHRDAVDRALLRRAYLKEARLAQQHDRRRRVPLLRRLVLVLGTHLVVWGERLQQLHTPAPKT